MKNIFVSALVAAIVSIGFAVLMPAGHKTSSGVAVPQQAESVYDRVMRAGKSGAGTSFTDLSFLLNQTQV